MSLFARVMPTEPMRRSAPSRSRSHGSLFERVSPADSPPPEPTEFSSYVKHTLLTGERPVVEEAKEPDYEPSNDHIGIEDEIVEEIEEDEDEDEESQLLDEEAPSSTATPHSLVRSTRPLPNFVGTSSSEQKNDSRARDIVDNLFERMGGLWGTSPEKSVPSEQTRPTTKQEDVGTPPPPPTPKPATTSTALTTTQRHLLAESRNDVTKVIRAEVPRLIKTELATVLRTEIIRAVREELSRIVREEFSSLQRLVERLMDNYHTLDARMAKIEGAVSKDTVVKIAKGAVQNNFEIPEREVKVAAPVNVQPPSVTFDEGAIKVNFHKGEKGSREVQFDRDRHGSIQGAKIVDAPER